MSLEDRIRSLTEAIVRCRDEAQAAALAEELQQAIREHLEGLRKQFKGVLPVTIH